MKINKGFTLIELLVVVLIIGILAAIAVPYYQESVERSIMQEAIINLKAIAQANDAFFLANGRYANAYEMDKLDISIPGTTFSSEYPGRIQTKYFVYSPNGTQKRHKAVAQRKPFNTQYYLAIFPNNKMECGLYGNNSSQIKLCDQINQEGHL